MANPRPDRAADGVGTRRGASIQMHAPRPPRAANDNPTSLTRRLYQMFPLVAALVILFWALWNVVP